MRVVGWAFLNAGHLSWATYQSKVEYPRQKGTARRYEYKYQVNHIEGGPQAVLLDQLKLGTAKANALHGGANAKSFCMAVWKEPAMKRPAPST